jgi:mannitol 2-dehydrogenase
MSQFGNETDKIVIPLGSSRLVELSRRMSTPSYDRRSIARSIVHIGVGGFFRAHQAVYLDDLQKVSPDAAWGYCGVGLLQHDSAIRDALAKQDSLYTVIERSKKGDAPRIVGSLLEFLYAPENPEAVLDKLADPGTRIVTLTITEGGYYVDCGSGGFDETHPDIVHDLAHPHQPLCSFGYLAEALDRRRERGVMPFTIMSCDNIQGNGDTVREMLLAFCNRRDVKLGAWLEAFGAFPNSMVDRITPATTDKHRDWVRESFGVDDAWPVVTEPFRQWVIQDRFTSGRPAWERVGAQMTDDVEPYEIMKLRLLNASHQAMCYIGMLLGYEFTNEAMSDRNILRLVTTMMEVEVTPLIPEVPGVDLAQYKRSLIERFSSPAIKDQLSRIGTEGSARIPKFVLPSIQEQLARDGPISLLTFTVAAWFRSLRGKDDRGLAVPVNDPYADRLRRLAAEGGEDPRALLSMRSLFGALSENSVFVERLAVTLASIYRLGARAALEKILE